MFSLSTCWFVGRTDDGAKMVDEALEMGFGALELGYALRPESAASILDRADMGDIAISSVHAFSPAPADKPGHPELYSPSDTNEEKRALAVSKLLETLDFAKRAGAGAVVLHAGRIVRAARLWMWVHGRIIADSADGFWYRWQLKRMLEARGRGIEAALASLRQSLSEALPAFEEAGVKLAIENLPSFDAIPSPGEADSLVAEFGGSPSFALWYDMGHGQVMENAGYGSGLDYARRHFGNLAGIHIHDVIGPAGDHQTPGQGGMDFKAYSFLAALDRKVFEPMAGTPKEELAASRVFLEDLWRESEAGAASGAKGR